MIYNISEILKKNTKIEENFTKLARLSTLKNIEKISTEIKKFAFIPFQKKSITIKSFLNKKTRVFENRATITVNNKKKNLSKNLGFNTKKMSKYVKNNCKFSTYDSAKEIINDDPIENLIFDIPNFETKYNSILVIILKINDIK